MKLTRRYRFSSSHRLHSPVLSEDANRELYGKCNHPYGHGHDYLIEVTVRGPVDSETGRVVDVGALDRYVSERVVEPMDHRDLNRDVFSDAALVPTTENLALEIERRLRADWNFHRTELDRIWIQETKRNTFELKNL